MTSAPIRILVLDDEPGIGRLVAAALDHHVIEVFTEPSAALERAAEVSFDFVFCDFSMPGMTGIAFHDALLRIQPGLARSFVLMTGSAPCTEIHDFLSRTQVELLPKPFELSVLESLVEAAGHLGSEPEVHPEEPREEPPACATQGELLSAAASQVADCIREQAEACAAVVQALHAEVSALRRRAAASRAEAALESVPARAALRIHEASLAANAAHIVESALATKGAELKRLRAQAQTAACRSSEHQSRERAVWRITPARAPTVARAS